VREVAPPRRALPPPRYALLLRRPTLPHPSLSRPGPRRAPASGSRRSIRRLVARARRSAVGGSRRDPALAAALGSSGRRTLQEGGADGRRVSQRQRWGAEETPGKEKETGEVESKK
jgi:hypothetical protein